MSDTVYVFMCAYNAEKTIRKSLDCIKNQTYTNFLCHIINHGSLDETKNIIQEYVDSDNRFSTEYLGQEVGGITAAYAKKLAREHEAGYFITLDADDVYEENCFEELLKFAKQESLDVVACGNYFVLMQNGKILSERVLQDNLIICGERVSDDFPNYHQFMRTVWGKMYSLAVLRKCHFYFPKELAYGSDTLFAMEAFKCAEKSGILAKALHYYYISPKSQSYRVDKNRIISDSILFDYAVDFLFCKCGGFSTTNRNFLFIVYGNALRDTLNVLKAAEMDDVEKIALLYQMITNHYTRDLCYLGRTSDLFHQIANFLCSLDIFQTQKILEQAAEMLTILGLIPSSIAGVSEEKRFLLLLMMRSYWFERDYLPKLDNYIEDAAKKVPMLANKTAAWLEYFSDIVIDVIGNRKQEALEKIVSFIETEAILPKKKHSLLIELGLDLAAELEEQGLFVGIKKIQIMIYIQSDELLLAQKELDDWEKILPEDEDFKRLKQEIGTESQGAYI